MQPPAFVARDAARVNQALAEAIALRRHAWPARLAEAIEYALLGGGKRVRGVLALACARAVGGSDAKALAPALAVECVHAYSLVHDDLPAMDNDAWRRGKPACWKAFGEDVAILVGDALQALAFELLADAELPQRVRVALVRTLAEAAGAAGMVGGQFLDLYWEKEGTPSFAELERLHLHKTGMLIRWAAMAGATAAGADEDAIAHCRRYGESLGLLFQIADDVLDATATSAELGKTAGKDAAQAKATYVTVLGLAGARTEGEAMLGCAKEAAGLLPFPDELVQLADYVWRRRQ
ncbi:MAG: polyprenyl synthetase family protein [Zetaproteobacteria bacterium]|nr:MAG: polyprenyl synthetase family protein [Zetaproteobacteria bacterium]